MNRFFSTGLAGVLLALSVFASAIHAGDTPVEPAVRVAFRPDSTVWGDHYTVGDIAVVTGAAPSERKRIESVTVGRSPALGVHLPLSARVLAVHLERAGIGGEAVLDFPDRMVVRRASQEVDLGVLRRAIEKALRDRFSQDGKNMVIENIQLPASITLPAGQLSCRTDFRLPSRQIGLAAFTVDLMVDGVQRRRVSGTLHLDRKVEALQLASPVSRGERISDAACRPAPVRLSTLRGDPLLAEDLDANPTAKQDLRAGDALTWSNVEKQQLVRRGQLVRMVLESAGGMRISAQGQARSNGSYGDLVEVLNMTSGKRVQGFVAGEQLVRVPF